MIDRTRSFRLPYTLALPLALAALVACSDSPTETAVEPSVADRFAAGLAPGDLPDHANGQAFVQLSGQGFGFLVVEFPEMCAIFNEDPGDLPGSWTRSKPGDAFGNMDKVTITNGFVLVGSFFGGTTTVGSGHGTTQARFAADGTLLGLTTTIQGKTDDGRKIRCRNHVGADETVIDRYIEVR